MTLEELAQNPARFEGGKWRFPGAQELRETWLLPRETEREIPLPESPNVFQIEQLAIAFYRVQNREKSQFFARQLPRESAVLLHVAQILDDDETYVQEMARAGFATLGYFGYWENVVKIGGARFEKARAQIKTELAQAKDKRCAQTLRKLLLISGEK